MQTFTFSGLHCVDEYLEVKTVTMALPKKV